MTPQSKPQDKHIPGIDLLFDEQALTTLLGSTFDWDELTELRREYIRYKPSSSCLSLYQIKHGGKHYLVYLKAYSNKVKAEKAQQRIDLGTSLAQTHSKVDKNSNLVLNRYPFDTHLPALERLVDIKQRRKLLDRIFFAPTDTEETFLSPLQYKPERRFVAKLTLKDGTPLVIKLYTPQRYQCLNLKYLRGSNSPFGKIVGKSDKHCILIYEWIEGRPLHQTDPMGSKQLKPYYLCAQNLAQLHQRKPSKKLSKVNTPHFAHLLKQHAKSITTILPEQSSLTLWLADELVHQLSILKKERCFIHGDFYAEQVLVAADQVEFLDFDNLSCWFSAFDIGNFLSHLIYKAEIGILSKSNYNKVQQIFIDGYSGEREIDQSQVSLFVAIGIFQLMYHPLRFGLPNWQAASNRLLTETFSYLTQSLPLLPEHSFRKLVNHCLNPNVVQPKSDVGLDNWLPIKHATLTRYKVDKRALIEYASESQPHHVIIGKIRAKGLDISSWENQKALYDGEFGDNAIDNIHVPKPLFTQKELHAWFQTKVIGEAIFTPFCENTNPSLSHAVALAIYKLHNTSLTLYKEHSTEKELEILRSNIAKVIEQKPDLAARLQQLLDWCAIISQQLSSTLIKPIHRDFYHDQLLWNGKKLYLLDFDLLCLGSPYLDLGNFIAHIQEQSLRVYDDPFFAQQNINQFTSRYLLLSGHKDALKEIEIYRLLTLVRHIAISQRIPQRQIFTTKIIEFSEDQIVSFLEQNNLL